MIQGSVSALLLSKQCDSESAVTITGIIFKISRLSLKCGLGVLSVQRYNLIFIV